MTGGPASRKTIQRGLREAAEIEIKRIQTRDNLRGSDLSTGPFWPILVHLSAQERACLLSESVLAEALRLHRPLICRCLQLLRTKGLVEIYDLATESVAVLSDRGLCFMEQLLSSPFQNQATQARQAVVRRARRLDNAIVRECSGAERSDKPNSPT